MSSQPFDPAGHLTLAVNNLKRSKQFYTNLFEQLGFKQILNSEQSVAWATREGFGIWIKQAKHVKPRYKYFVPGLQHLCFKAKTRKAVDEVYKIFVARKRPFFEAPKSYPDYTPKYYAVLFADPDGIKIEVAYY